MRGRVLFIAGSHFPGRCGVAHYTQRLRAGLAAGGIESTLLTTREAADAGSDPTLQGVVDDWSPRALAPLLQAVRREEPALLHIQFAQGSYRFRRSIFLLPQLLRWSGWRAPLVTTLHEYGQWDWQPPWLPRAPWEWLKEAGQRRGWWDREAGFLLTRSDRIVVTHGKSEALVAKRLPALRQRLRPIPLAPNLDPVSVERRAARSHLRAAHGWPDDAEVIAFFGFVHPVKGIETLLRAFARLAPFRPGARLLILGGSESVALPGEQAAAYLDSLQRLTARLALGGRVAFTGYLPADEASRQLQGCDLGVLPFHHGVDLKSGSLLALFAHRLPVVAAIPEGSAPFKDDLVARVAPRSVEPLYGAIARLLDDPEERRRFADAGARFAESFSWEGILAAHRALYAELGAG